jgi:hypothetical protein
MGDNGSAMLAARNNGGLARLGILHETTLPYARFQNGKQESFWNFGMASKDRFRPNLSPSSTV